MNNFKKTKFIIRQKWPSAVLSPKASKNLEVQAKQKSSKSLGASGPGKTKCLQIPPVTTQPCLVQLYDINCLGCICMAFNVLHYVGTNFVHALITRSYSPA